MDNDNEIERIRTRKLEELTKKIKYESSKPKGPVKITDNNFNEILKTNELVLVDFWAEWCMPCKMISPIVEEIGRNFNSKLTVGKMNVDENRLIPSQLGINSIPTILLFKNGSLVDGVIGAVPKSTLEIMIKKWMKE